MVLDSDAYEQHSSLRQVVAEFLQSGAWDKSKATSTKKVNLNWEALC